MNYRYTSKKYRTIKKVMVGDLVQMNSQDPGIPELSEIKSAGEICGYVTELHEGNINVGQSIYNNIVTVNFPHFGGQTVCRLEKLELIDRRPPRNTPAILERWLKSGNIDPQAKFRPLKGDGDNAILLTINSRIIALIDRRSVKICSTSLHTKGITPILTSFAATHKMRVSRLNRPDLAPSIIKASSISRAAPFWKTESAQNLNTLAEEWNISRINSSSSVYRAINLSTTSVTPIWN